MVTAWIEYISSNILVAFATYFSYVFIASMINLYQHFMSLQEEPLSSKQKLAIILAMSVFLLENAALLTEYFEKNYKFFIDSEDYGGY